jgi:ABC-type multidrug transport system ATPase subunit
LRRTPSYLPQEFGAYPRTSALAMLKYLAALKGIHGSQQRQVVENLLVKTNLWDARNKSVDKFSGGMKQRYLTSSGSRFVISFARPSFGAQC